MAWPLVITMFLIGYGVAQRISRSAVIILIIASLASVIVAAAAMKPWWYLPHSKL